jgi:two-component system OmpR family sensor kinase
MCSPSAGLHGAAESDLLERLRAAEEAVRARDDFIAIAAHELRSPMTALALRLQALEQAALLGGESRLAIDIQRTRRSVDRYVARAVVLLDVSRLNAGDHAPARTPVRIRDLVRDVVESHEDEARFHGASVTAEVHGDHVAFWDAHMAEQILSNLVNNAIKYGAGTPVSVRATVEDGVACIAVSDRGPGIGDEQRARIFDKFERVVSGTRYRSGYGLGLWIVARMVRAHGGTIDIAAAPGGGALFLVRLPLNAAQPAGQEGQ